MSESQSDSDSEIKESDIIFDCPLCGKSLAIDFRGAGLTIPCTDCGESVVVPIPEGLDLNELDEARQLGGKNLDELRESLTLAARKAAQAALMAKQAGDDAARVPRGSDLYRTAAILERIGLIQKSLEDIGGYLEDLTDMVQQDSAGPR